jgi:hypothetical protein
MTIQTITGRNFNGSDFEHEVGPVTIFAGPNRTGKTAALLACWLALQGRINGLPRGNQGVFLVSSGTEMSAMVRMADGAIYQHAFRQTAKSVRTVTEQPFAGTLATLDSAELAGAKGNALIKLIFEAAHVKFDVAAISKAVREICPTLTESDENCKALSAALAVADGEDNAQAWFNGAIARLTDQRKLAKAAARRMRETTAGTSKLTAEDAVQSETRLRELEEELKALREEIGQKQGALNLKKEQAEQRKEEWAQWNVGFAEAQRAVNALDAPEFSAENPPRPLAAVQQELADLRSRNRQSESATRALNQAFELSEKARRELPELTTKLHQAKSRLAESESAKERLPIMEQAEAEHKTKLAGLRQERDRLHNELTTARREAADAAQAVEDLRAAVAEQKRQADDEIARWQAMDACPTCHLAGTDWCAQLVAEKQAAVAKASQEAHDKIEAKVNAGITLANKMGQITQSIEEMKAKIASMEKGEEALPDSSEVKSSANALAERREAVESAQQLVDAAEKAATTNTTKPGDGVALEDETALAREAQVLAARDAFAVATRNEPKLLSTCFDKEEAEIAALAAQAEEMKGDVEAKQQVLQNHRTTERIMEQAAQEADQADREATEWDGAVKHLEAERAEKVEAVLVPILRTVNLFTAGIMPEVEFRDGKVVYLKDGNAVTMETFSGAEKQAACAGIQAALAAQADLKICFCDELVFDDDNLLLFLGNVRRAVEAGAIAQFIGTAHALWDKLAPNFYERNQVALEGVTVIRTGQ